MNPEWEFFQVNNTPKFIFYLNKTDFEDYTNYFKSSKPPPNPSTYKSYFYISKPTI